MIEVEMMPAKYGDAIWLRYGKDEESLHHVLIDTGFEPTANEIRKRLHETDIQLDLFVLTHIDADHIEGSIYLLQDLNPDRVQDVWFNGWEHIDSVADDALGALQGEYFSALIRKRGLPWNEAVGGKPIVVPDDGPLPKVTLAGGMELTLLSPSVDQLKRLRSYWVTDLKGRLKAGDEEAALRLLDADEKYAIDALGRTTNVERLITKKFKEDPSKANGSSIAFLAEYDGKCMLFTGDAHPSVLVNTLDRLGEAGNPLEIELFKVAHHGSGYNTSPALLERIRCKHALISTNGIKFEHPDAECIARIVHAHDGGGLTLHFNYSTDFTKPWKESALKRRFSYDVNYGDNGSLTVKI
jgi:hypothetical protein